MHRKNNFSEERIFCSRCKLGRENIGYILIKKGWENIKEDCECCPRKGLSYDVYYP